MHTDRSESVVDPVQRKYFSDFGTFSIYYLSSSLNFCLTLYCTLLICTVYIAYQSLPTQIAMISSWYIGFSPLLLPLISADPATVSFAATRATSAVVAHPVLTSTCSSSTFTNSDVEINIGDKDDDGNATVSVLPSLLCLHSLNPRSHLYLKTLLRSRKRSNSNHTVPSIITRTYDDELFDDCKKELNYCWTWEPKTTISPHDPQVQKQKRYRRRKRQRQALIKLSSSSTITDVINNSSNSSNKIKLFLTSANFRNNDDIALPPLIAELVQQRTKSTTKQSDDDDDDDDDNDESTTHSGLSPTVSSSSSSSSQSSSIDDQRSFQIGNPLINLTGRWRPATTTITTSDLIDYDSFLKACCSDTITYWIRQLLTSSSIVSRQELAVKQLDGGLVMEFVDVHPLSSKIWNRTIMTSSRISSEISSRSSGTINATGLTENTNNYRPYVNRLKDPYGDPILVEAYWQNNGTVHTTLSRKSIASNSDKDNGDSNSDENNPIEWIEMNRYLLLEEEGEHHHHDNNLEEEREKNRVLVCETIFYSMSSPPPIGVSNTTGAMAKMTWRWEEVS